MADDFCKFVEGKGSHNGTLCPAYHSIGIDGASLSQGYKDAVCHDPHSKNYCELWKQLQSYDKVLSRSLDRMEENKGRFIPTKIQI